jgi:hypothetical protein
MNRVGREARVNDLKTCRQMLEKIDVTIPDIQSKCLRGCCFGEEGLQHWRRYYGIEVVIAVNCHTLNRAVVFLANRVENVARDV